MRTRDSSPKNIIEHLFEYVLNGYETIDESDSRVRVWHGKDNRARSIKLERTVSIRHRSCYVITINGTNTYSTYEQLQLFRC